MGRLERTFHSLKQILVRASTLSMEQRELAYRTAHQLIAVAMILGISGCGGADSPAATDSSLNVPAPVEHLADVAVREPMLVEHPGGDLFVAGYSQAAGEADSPPRLFRSRDGGSSWSAVDVGSAEQGAVGNSDVDLAVAPDGTLYFLTMGFDRTTSTGTHVAVGVSHDVGESWTWTWLSEDRFDDRPWISVAPNGAAHVIWNDGSGVSHAVSEDGGHTWTERDRIHPLGGSSHLAVGPAGELAVRITPLSASGNRFDADVEIIATSNDGGSTWAKQTPPGHLVWSETFGDPEVVTRWVEPLAWDADGVLYHLWSEGTDLWVGRSDNRGRSWDSWLIVSGSDPLFYPFLSAGGPGELAASWFSGSGESLRANVALIDASGEDFPLVRRGEPIEVDAWRMAGESRMRDTGGEYVPVIFLADGSLGLVAPIQNGTGGRQGFAWYRVGL